MSDEHETKPKTVKPPQFSLLTLMLWVTLVGLYLGLARWNPPIFHKYITPLGALGVYVIGILGIYLILRLHRLKIPLSTTALIFASGLAFPLALWIGVWIEKLVITPPDTPYSLREIALNHGNWATIFIISFAFIRTIVHCKKQTGSFLPSKKRPEGESNG